VPISGGYTLLFDDPSDATALQGLYAIVDAPAPPSSWLVTLVLPATSRPLNGLVRIQVVASCVGG
jgi:hypothetical protein